MMDSFIIKGQWFLSRNIENQVQGTLTFDPQEGIELELYGCFDEYFLTPKFGNQEIILGIASDSKQITLFNCLITQLGGVTMIPGLVVGIPSIKYSIRYLLIGTHANTTADLVFNQVSAEIFNLGEWVGISGFQPEKMNLKKFENRETTVNYKQPKSIEFSINTNTKGRLDFIANHSGLLRYQNVVTIKQRVEFQATSDQDKSIDDLLSYVSTFQNFLILALYRSTYPISIILNGEKHKDNFGDGITSKKEIKLFFSSRIFNTNDKPKADIEMIFDYQRIQNEFPHTIKNWYSKYELLEPAFNLVFEQFYIGNKFTVNTFLNLAQSAETFHSRLNNHTKIPRDLYKKMKKDIISVVPIEYHSWLNEQFNFGNNLNLHSRLTEIIDKYSNPILDKILGNKEQFVLDVKHSRNYYTHYSTNSKKNALKGEKLFRLSEKLKILLVCSYLVEIGINKEKLSDLLDKIKGPLFNHLLN